MGRRDKIREENIKKWIQYISIFLITIVIIFFSIFYIYNRNLRKEAEMNLREYSTIEKLVPTEEITDVSISDDKTIEVVLNKQNDGSNNKEEEKIKAIQKEASINKVENKIEKDKIKENVKEQEKKEENKEKEENGEVEKTNTNINVQNKSISDVIDNKIDEVDNTTKINENLEVNNNEISNEDLKFEIPLVGEIINDYAKDSLIYSKTLEEWGAHLGIDIKAPKTTVVKAAERGAVEKINTDPRYGNSITIDHGNGFKTVYSSLLVSDFFKVGEEVQKGDNIGTVGDSASFEKAEDSHLHFEMYKDGENVNPTIYLK